MFLNDKHIFSGHSQIVLPKISDQFDILKTFCKTNLEMAQTSDHCYSGGFALGRVCY